MYLDLRLSKYSSARLNPATALCPQAVQHMPKAQCCSLFPSLGVGQAARADQQELRPEGQEGGSFLQGSYSRPLLATTPPEYMSPTSTLGWQVVAPSSTWCTLITRPSHMRAHKLVEKKARFKDLPLLLTTSTENEQNILLSSLNGFQSFWTKL